jgi:tRNA-Thr(GGU) m(6)t(6)A37 methyltransferase TsaA
MRWLRRLFDNLLRLFGYGGGPVPREPVSIRPIAVVRNNVFDPQPDGWETVRSDLIFREELMPALEDIEGYSHVIVVFNFHRVPEAERSRLRLHPRDDTSLPEQGVLATRTQLRPSGIGITVVPIVQRRRNILRVLGLDAIDGTPVLDIKPYLPPYDSVPDARMPEWAQRRFDEAASTSDGDQGSNA